MEAEYFTYPRLDTPIDECVLLDLRVVSVLGIFTYTRVRGKELGQDRVYRFVEKHEERPPVLTQFFPPYPSILTERGRGLISTPRAESVLLLFE